MSSDFLRGRKNAALSPCFFSETGLDFQARLDAAGLRVARSGGWLRICAAWRDSKDFNIAVHPTGGGWKDHVTGEHGNWRSLCQMIGIDDGLPAGTCSKKHFSSDAEIAAKKRRAESEQRENSRRIDQARRAWDAARPLSISTTEWAREWARDYLQSRGEGIFEAALAAGARVLDAQHPAAQGRPCLLWPMRDARTSEVVGVQREWGRGHTNKRMLGRHMTPIDPAQPDVQQSAGFLFPGREKTLYICEGQISGAAVAAVTTCQTIVLFDTSGLRKPPRSAIERAIRRGTTRIIIAGDSGKPGEDATLACIRAIQTWGLKTEIVWTVPPGEDDWADILERAGQQAVRDALAAGVREIPADPDHDGPAETYSMRPWRKAANPAPVAPAADVERVRHEILRPAIDDMISDYRAFLARASKKKRYAPLIVKTTTGTGKSTELRALANNAALLAAGGACLALVPDHSQADAYQTKGWWHYYGRNPNPASPAYCPAHSEMMKAVEAGHIPQAEFCFTCKHGLAWAAAKKDDCNDPSLRDVEPCAWQQHLRDTMEEQFVVACSQSYSETLAKWTPGGKKHGAVPRLVLVDEHASMSASVAVGLDDIDTWIKRIDLILPKLEVETTTSDAITKAVGEMQFESARKLAEARRGEVEAYKTARALLTQLAGELAKWVGKEGRLTISADLQQSLDQLAALDDDDTTRWEKLSFNPDGSLAMTPLRAAWSIRDTLRHGDGHVKNAQIHVAGVKPLLSRVGKKPIAFFDATPDPATIAACAAAGGKIIDAIAQQHVNIIRYPMRFCGLNPLRKDAPADQRARTIEQYRALRKLHPEAAMLVHKRAHDLLDPEDKNGNRSDPLMGHWGAQHRAHDDWSGKDLVICGGFYAPADTWRQQYLAARVAALAAGAPEADWPTWPDNMPMQQGCWETEIDHEVQSRMPLPADPHIRGWLLSTITAETVQAVGRVRGANLNQSHPATIHIFGGVPLVGLGDYGLQVSEYRRDPREIGASRANQALAARQAVAEAHDAGARTIRQILEWIHARTGLRVGIDRVRSVLREIEALARKTGEATELVAARVAAKADAYLSDARGDLAAAVSAAARVPDDLAAAEMLDAALRAQVESAIATRTGPPALTA